MVGLRIGPRASGLGLRPALMIAIATGCGHADAQPGTPPPWPAIPEIASSANDAAKAAGLSVATAGAWGDRARGCYAISIDLRGGSASTAQELVAALAADGIATSDVAGTDIVTMAIARAPYRGRLRAAASGDELGVRACFWSDREPDACAKTCTEWLR